MTAIRSYSPAELAALLPGERRELLREGALSRSELTAARTAALAEGASKAEFGFGDLLDLVNPLQHLPVVSTIYRALTGDEIQPTARVLGDTLYGGPFGLLAGLANVISEQVSGRDLGENLLAFAFEDETAVADTAVAAAEPLAEFGPEPQAKPGAAEPAPLETAAGDRPTSLQALPEGGLSGTAALAAFAADLGRLGLATGTGPGAAPPPGPGPATHAAALRPQPLPHAFALARRPGLPAAAHAPPVATAELQMPPAADPAASFSERLLDGLDKYRSMNGGPGSLTQRRGTAHDESY